MPAEIGRLDGDDHEMARGGRDRIVAAPADVPLRGLVGLDAPDLNRLVRGVHPQIPQITARMQTARPSPTYR